MTNPNDLNATATANSKYRPSNWIDGAKGVAIILVVIGHAWRGINEQIYIDPGLYRWVDDHIYAFHMPVFFALSGYFLARTLSDNSVLNYIAQRLTKLIVPMVIWTYLFIGVKILAGNSVNSEAYISDLLIFPIPGVLHLWFLWSLFVMQIFMIASVPFIHQGKYSSITLFFMFIISSALPFVILPDPVYYWIGSAMSNAPFLLLGVIISQKFDLSKTNIYTRAAAALLFFLVLFQLDSFPDGKLSLIVTSYVLAFSFIVLLSGTNDWFPCHKFICFLGMSSMTIYLSHTIFSAAFRELLFEVGQQGVLTHMLVGVLSGLICPLIFFRIATKLRILRYFGL